MCSNFVSHFKINSQHNSIISSMSIMSIIIITITIILFYFGGGEGHIGI